MKKIMYLIFLFIGITQVTIANQEQNPAQCLDIELSINFNEGHPLQKDVFGVNNNLASSPYYLSNEGFEKKYRELGKPTMRYPGGTVSNYLNLKTGFAEVWDNADQRSIDRRNDTNAAFPKKGKPNGEDLNQYIDFLKTTGAKSTFVMNMTTMTDAEAANVLQQIKDAGADIKYFELGNELFYRTYETAIPTVEDYLEKCRNRTNIIRSIFPNAKVGILCPGEPYSDEVFLDDPNPSAGLQRQIDWYEGIKNQGLYDAIVVHTYSSVGMDRNTSSDDYLPFEESYTHCISHADKQFPIAFNTLQNDFPNKEIWVTEYHVGGFAGELRQYRLRYSYLGGLFTANFMLKMFGQESVSLSSWHSMVQMLTFNNPPNFTLLDDDYEFGTNINFELLKLFKKPVRNSNEYKPVSITGSQKYNGLGNYTGQFNDLEAGAFHNSNTGVGYVVLFNKKENSYAFNKSVLQADIAGEILSVKQYSPDQSIALEGALSSENELDIKNIQAINDSYEIPGYSVTIIEYRLSNPPPVVNIIKPTNNQIFTDGNNIVIKANANDNSAINELKLFIDGQFVSSDDAAPYRWVQDLTPGRHRIKVIAFDDEGAKTIVKHRITVSSLRLSDDFGTVYPIPFNDYLIIDETETITAGTARIADQLGRTLLEAPLSDTQTRLDMSALQRGIYVLIILDEHGTPIGRKKLVK